MLNEFIESAKQFKRQNHNNMAVIELATLFCNDRYASIDPRDFFSEEQRVDILQLNKNESERLSRIFSIGVKWNDDEYMLILSFLLNYRLLKDYYSHYHLGLSIDNQIMILIGDFRYTIKSKENYKSAFHSASLIIKSRKKEINKDYLANFFNELGLVG